MDNNSTPPELLEIFQEGIKEILPVEQFLACFSPPDVCSLSMVEAAGRAEKNLGFLSASGLFFRAGTAGFKYLIRKYGKVAGIDNLEFRMQPQRKRLMDGVERITALLLSWKTVGISINQNGDSITLKLSSITGKEGNDVDLIWQNFFAGMMQEFLSWAGAGKQYPFQVKMDEKSKILIIWFQIQPTD